MGKTADEIIRGAIQLPSLPEVVMRTCEMIRDPKTCAADIGNIIAEDAGLTTRLLKIVNSPYYGFPSKIETVSRAITVIGTLELLDLVLATTVVKMFKGMPNELVDMENYWGHSLYCGVLAKLIAKAGDQPNLEHFFVAGLIHDIGSLVLYRKLPDQSQQAIAYANANKVPLYQAEKEIIGFNHAEVGGALARLWQLPSSLEEAIEFHHNPSSASTHTLEAAVVNLANSLSLDILPTPAGCNTKPEIDENIWEVVHVSSEDIEALTEAATEEFEEAKTLIYS